MKKSSKNLYLYIHFPFCVKKCHYCDFYSITQQSQIPAYFKALFQEIQHYQSILASHSIKTIYIGGGSPNLIPPALLEKVTQQLDHFLDAPIEFTLEINPGNISHSNLVRYKKLGINRISIGSQSFCDKELDFLGRIHRSQQINKTIAAVIKNGIDNFSLDLIFGIPGQTQESWEQSLNSAIESGTSHLSVYNLVYEPGTPLTQLRNRGKIQLPEEELEFQFFQYAHQRLQTAGFDHYEISNFSLPEKESKHNSAYWLGEHYLGFGPAAHSFYGGNRWQNIASVSDYIARLSKNRSPITAKKSINQQEHIQEQLLLGLRQKSGLNIPRYEALTNVNFSDILSAIETRFRQTFLEKYATKTNNNLQLTIEGWFICDYIVRELNKITEDFYNDNKKN